MTGLVLPPTQYRNSFYHILTGIYCLYKSFGFRVLLGEKSILLPEAGFKAKPEQHRLSLLYFQDSQTGLF